MSSWFVEHVEKPVARGIEHSLDTLVDHLVASGNTAQIEAEVNKFIENSPLVKLLNMFGTFGTMGLTLVEGEIDSIIEHNTGPAVAQKIKDYIHGRLLIK